MLSDFVICMLPYFLHVYIHSRYCVKKWKQVVKMPKQLKKYATQEYSISSCWHHTKHCYLFKRNDIVEKWTWINILSSFLIHVDIIKNINKQTMPFFNLLICFMDGAYHWIYLSNNTEESWHFKRNETVFTIFLWILMNILSLDCRMLMEINSGWEMKRYWRFY